MEFKPYYYNIEISNIYYEEIDTQMIPFNIKSTLGGIIHKLAKYHTYMISNRSDMLKMRRHCRKYPEWLEKRGIHVYGRRYL